MSRCPDLLRRACASLVFVYLLASAPKTASAQPDIAAFGERMGASEELYGVGGSLVVPLKKYRYDIVLGGNYFFAPSDTTSVWTVNLDTHLNLFTLRFLRPYYGVGLNYHNRNGDRVGVNLKAGTYIRLRNRIIPYVQYTYRTIPDIEHSYFQVGIRLMLRPQ